MNATFTRNETHKGLEITFTAKPSRETLDTLKASGFRWHSQKKLWYAKETEKRLELVQALTGNTEAQPTKETQKPKTEAVNKYGVEIGDVFSLTWGYEQTQTDFFQVIALCGSSSVRVVEVNPRYEVENGYSHGMAEDRIYRFKKGELLPKALRSVFIEDQEKGDLKRVTSFRQDKLPCITLGRSGHYAEKVQGDSLETYESWYY